MEVTKGTVDLGNAHEVFCSGIAHMEIVDNAVVRITIYTNQSGEKVQTLRLTWTVPGWLRAREDARKFAEELVEMLMSSDQHHAETPGLAPH